jgi:BON domain
VACHSQSKDAIIARDIQMKVSADPATQDSRIAVNSENGEVILKGTNKNRAARQQVEKIAWEEPGVSNVNNQTTVEGEGPASSSAPARLAVPAPTQVLHPPLLRQPVVVLAETDPLLPLPVY